MKLLLSRSQYYSKLTYTWCKEYSKVCLLLYKNLPFCTICLTSNRIFFLLSSGLNSFTFLDQDKKLSNSKECFIRNKDIITHFISCTWLNDQKPKNLQNAFRFGSFIRSLRLLFILLDCLMPYNNLWHATINQN